MKAPTTAELIAAKTKGIKSSEERVIRAVAHVEEAKKALIETQRQHASTKAILADWQNKLIPTE